MNISRRKFMKAGILVAACAGLPLKVQWANAQKGGDKRSVTSSVPQVSPQKPVDLLGYFNKSTFTPYVGTEFRVHLSSSKVRRIKLVEVKDYVDSSGQKAARGGEESFSLFFTAPSWRTFPQNTYEVEHPALGKFQLFLVPTGMRSGGEQFFEAAFNRLNK